MKKLIVAIAVAALGVGSLGVSPVAAASPEPPPERTRLSKSGATRTRRTATGPVPASITPGDSGPEGGAEDDVLAKRVDARAIQPDKDPGGKDTATERYNATAGVVQGWFCGEVRG